MTHEFPPPDDMPPEMALIHAQIANIQRHIDNIFAQPIPLRQKVDLVKVLMQVVEQGLRNAKIKK